MAETQVQKRLDRARWSLIIQGALAILVGIAILARPLASVAALALIIAIWALVHGAVNIVHAFDLRPIAKHWWVMLLSGIVSVAFGAAALYYYPGLSLAFAVIWTAWWLMLGGIAGITVAVYEKRAGMSWGWTMTWGIVGVVASLIAFANPPATLAALMAMLSAFGIVGGIVLIVAAVRAHRAADEFITAVHGLRPH